MIAKPERHGRHVAVDPRIGQRAHPPRQHLRRQRLAQPSQRQRAKGHAELHRGEQIVKVALQAPHRPRARHPRRQQLFHAGFANGNQRELNRHKVGVGQNQHGHGDRLDEQELVHLAVRIALEGEQHAGEPVCARPFHGTGGPPGA